MQRISEQDIATMKAQAKERLNIYYNLDTDDLPSPRPKSEWKEDNKRGFFLGIIEVGENSHIIQLYQHLADFETFEIQQRISDNDQLEDPTITNLFIDDMYEFYIQPFHPIYYTPSCRTPVSRASSAKRIALDNVPELTHENFKNAVKQRDKGCLFFWDMSDDVLEACHIVARKDTGIDYKEKEILVRCRLDHKHHVRNGLLLCASCHSKFDKLHTYVDIVNDKSVVKVLYELEENRWRDGRSAVENWGNENQDEFVLYFVEDEQNKLPSKEALRFHKAACLIWRLAGGAESQEDYCSDDDDLGPVDTAALKRRFNIQD